MTQHRINFQTERTNDEWNKYDLLQLHQHTNTLRVFFAINEANKYTNIKQKNCIDMLTKADAGHQTYAYIWNNLCQMTDI